MTQHTQEQKWTVEPWRLERDPCHFHSMTSVRCGRGSPIAEANIEQDAARIVACVNACSGMADPVGEIAELRRQLAEMTVERDAVSVVALYRRTPSSRRAEGRRGGRAIVSKVTGTIRAKIWRDTEGTDLYVIRLADFHIVESGKTEQEAVAAAEHHLFGQYAISKKLGIEPFAGIVKFKKKPECEGEAAVPLKEYKIALPQVIWDAMKEVQP